MHNKVSWPGLPGQLTFRILREKSRHKLKTKLRIHAWEQSERAQVIAELVSFVLSFFLQK